MNLTNLGWKRKEVCEKRGAQETSFISFDDKTWIRSRCIFLPSFCICLSISARQFLRVTPAGFEAAAAMGDLVFVESYRQKCVRASEKKEKVSLLLHSLKLDNNLDLTSPIDLCNKSNSSHISPLQSNNQTEAITHTNTWRKFWKT